jgi:hypothetical protein
VLTVNAVASSVLLAASALFTAATPHAVIVTVLLVAGFFRSLQFTSLNALGYCDIDPDRMSQSTSFVGVVQQLSLSSGVAVAALVLDLLRAADGRTTLLASDFAVAFVVVGVIAVASVVTFFRLAPDAGAEVSGHRPGGET